MCPDEHDQTKANSAGTVTEHTHKATKGAHATAASRRVVLATASLLGAPEEADQGEHRGEGFWILAEASSSQLLGARRSGARVGRAASTPSGSMPAARVVGLVARPRCVAHDLTRSFHIANRRQPAPCLSACCWCIWHDVPPPASLVPCATQGAGGAEQACPTPAAPAGRSMGAGGEAGLTLAMAAEAAAVAAVPVAEGDGDDGEQHVATLQVGAPACLRAGQAYLGTHSQPLAALGSALTHLCRAACGVV